MTATWRSFDIYLPNNLTRDEVRTKLRLELQRCATDTGEFAAEIRIDRCQNADAGWRKWSAAYRAGPPGVLRVAADDSTHSSLAVLV
jgi:hypothetical protein